MTSLTPGSAPRFARRQRHRRILALWPWLVAVLLACGLGLAVWTVAFSSVLDVRSVTVRGATSLPVDRVERAAAVSRGAPLARVDVDAVADRVRDLRPVRTVTVKRDWPHAIVVTVEERDPVAALRDGFSFLLVDRRGVAFRRVDRVPAGLPRIEVTTWGREERAATVRAAAAVTAGMPRSLARRVEQVTARSPDSITLQLPGGVRVVWGSAERSARKSEVLAALLERHRGTGTQAAVSVYDVSVPDLPTTRS